MKILFVCTGNICRSPMAEFLLKKKLADMGRKDVQVASAGVSVMPGVECTTEAKQALSVYGVSDVRHTAQAVNATLVDWADLILTMDEHHMERVVGSFPQAAGKIYVLNAFAGLGTDGDGIRDPYGHPDSFYKDVLMKINRALEKILTKI